VCELAADPPPRAEAIRALAAIRALPDTYRETLMMRLVEGLSGPEIVAFVPHGMMVSAIEGRGVGIPVALDTAPEVRTAIERFDDGATTSVRTIVEHATVIDMVTLWHLIARTHGPDREAVVRALEALVGRPFDYSVVDMLAATPEALEAWREEIAWEWLLR
jgi:hypothetical protein